jgi:hypothetical protein
MSTQTQTQTDILDWLKNFDFCHRCDPVSDTGGKFRQDELIEELERLRGIVQSHDRAARDRVLITVTISANREYVPGFGYDPEDWVKAASARMAQMLGCYDPKVVSATWAPVE